MRFAHKIMYGGAASLVSLLTRFAATACTARILSPESFGQFTYWWWISEMIALGIGLGWGSAANVSISSEHDPTKARHKAAAIMALSFLSLTLFGAIAYAVMAAIHSNLAMIVATTSVLSALGTICSSILIGLHRMKLLAVSQVVGSVLVLLGTSCGAFIIGWEGCLAGLAAGFLPPIAACLYVTRGKGMEFPNRDFFKIGIATLVAAISGVLVWSKADLWALALHHEHHVLGTYSVLLTYFSIPATMVAQLSGPLISHLSLVRNTDQEIRIFKMGNEAAIGFMLGTTTALAWWHTSALSLLFGPGYSPTIDVLVMLALGAIAQGPVLVGPAIMARKLFWQPIALTIGAGIILVPALVYFSSLGVAHVAAAKSAVQILLTTVCLAVLSCYDLRLSTGRACFSSVLFVVSLAALSVTSPNLGRFFDLVAGAFFALLVGWSAVSVDTIRRLVDIALSLRNRNRKPEQLQTE